MIKAPSKHKNIPTIVDGLRFDSKREAARWQQLKLLQRAGKITELERQVVFELAPSVKYSDKRPTRPIRYIADFAYLAVVEAPTVIAPSGKVFRYTVEDSKGMRTPVYKIKRHLMLSVHKIEVLET